MRSTTIAGMLAALALALAACGGDDDSSGASEEDAREAVIGTIAAYGDGPDWEAVCDLADERSHTALQEVTGADSCPAAYEEVYRRQEEITEKGENPIDQFAALLQEYEVGEAELTDEGAEVELTGPAGPATSFLVEEDGGAKVSELFVTPDAAANPGGFALPDDTQ
jgi:hypothetical protein